MKMNISPNLASGHYSSVFVYARAHDRLDVGKCVRIGGTKL